MMRSVSAAILIVCLAAFSASAQLPNYWEAIPPFVMNGPGVGAPPPPELPKVPFAPLHGVQLAGIVKVNKDYKVPGFWPPLWLGPKEVALLTTHQDQVTLIAYYGEHFNKSRVVADASTVNGEKILDLAVSRDGKHLAIAALKDNQLQIWMRDTQGDSPASVAATMNAACDKAGIVWLDPGTVAVGARCQPAAASPQASATPGQTAQGSEVPQKPVHSLSIVQIGAQQTPVSLGLDCLDHIDPTALGWSPDGQYALAQTIEERKWLLIDRTKTRCEPLKLTGLVPGGLIEWETGDRRFLFTAAPVRAPDPAHVAVMEYTIASQKARLLGSPAVTAAYVAGGGIAILGSHRLTAAVMIKNPNLLVPAEIAWVDALRSQLTIVQTGFSTTAPELLSATLRYSAARQLLATSFRTPGKKTAFTVLLWISAASKNGGVLGTGRVGQRMLSSWSPDGSKLAVLAGFPEHPTLAIIAAPQ